MRNAPPRTPEAVRRPRQALLEAIHAPATRDFGPGHLQALWREGGLSDIETSTLELAMDFSSFDDYWQPFLAGATPTPRLVAAVDVEIGGAIGRALAGRIARTWADRLTAR
jgi:hypothetical protein